MRVVSAPRNNARGHVLYGGECPTDMGPFDEPLAPDAATLPRAPADVAEARRAPAVHGPELLDEDRRRREHVE